MAVGRAFFGFDDWLAPNPSWTPMDGWFENLVTGFDIHRGRQTERDSTDAGTATIYINDTKGYFDTANPSSPYYGNLDGSQILLQVWNPVTLTWVSQFRGFVDGFSYDINPATNADGSLILANVQIDCIDLFDYLAGYELQPYPVNGDIPPANSKGTIFYEDTAGTVDDRIIQLLAEVTLDTSMQVVFSGNVSLQETKYDPGDSVLSALRDCADAEFPGIANIYVDKIGRFVFHGRYSRFDPDTVAASATPGAWNFRRWKIGDGVAILGDSTTAQMRVLSYNRSRSEVINSAISYPRHDPGEEDKIPGQVFEDASSIALYGKHSWSANDLIIQRGTTTGNDKWQECEKFGEFYVQNQKDPANRIKTLTVKSVAPADPRASATWGVLTGADISDIVNLSVGYPGGVGIQSTDYYVEGVTMRVRPLQGLDTSDPATPGYDYVELDLDVSPAEWSMDTHSVFAARQRASFSTVGAKAGGVAVKV